MLDLGGSGFPIDLKDLIIAPLHFNYLIKDYNYSNYIAFVGMIGTNWILLKRSITKCNRSIRNKNQCVTCEAVSTIGTNKKKKKAKKVILKGDCRGRTEAQIHSRSCKNRRNHCCSSYDLIQKKTKKGHFDQNQQADLILKQEGRSS